VQHMAYTELLRLLNRGVQAEKASSFGGRARSQIEESANRRCELPIWPSAEHRAALSIELQ